jgi:hypothetical protein
LILPIPAMAASSKPDESIPHYDINFVTGLTNQNNLEVKVPEDPAKVVQIYFCFTSNITSPYIQDNDLTDSDGQAIVWLPALGSYEVYAQIRGQAIISGANVAWWLQDGVHGFKHSRDQGKPQWWFFGEFGTGTTLMTQYQNYGGYSNFCTRWCNSTITTP